MAAERTPQKNASKKPTGAAGSTTKAKSAAAKTGATAAATASAKSAAKPATKAAPPSTKATKNDKPAAKAAPKQAAKPAAKAAPKATAAAKPAVSAKPSAAKPAAKAPAAKATPVKAAAAKAPTPKPQATKSGVAKAAPAASAPAAKVKSTIVGSNKKPATLAPTATASRPPARSTPPQRSAPPQPKRSRAEISDLMQAEEPVIEPMASDEVESDDGLDEDGDLDDEDLSTAVLPVIDLGDAPIDEKEEVTTEQLWDRYRVESDRLIAEMAAEMGLAPNDPAVLARKRELASSELEYLRNQLIERHYPLVRYIAERLLQTLPKSIELDDLVSAGQFGLMDAIRGFDPDRGIKFKTYCSTRVRGSILDQLRSQDWVPRLVRIKWSRIERALQQLTGEFGREPTHAELARVLDMSHDELSRELGDAQAKAMFSLSEKWDDDEDGSVEKVEVIEDHESVDPVRELNRRDLMKFITRSLTHKERFIIEQYYQYGHTMREIGEMLALTESRVCQIHSNVMGRLKGLLQQRTDSLSS
jgi:RNA polymerase sigma factor for flagellar operon FliA